MLFIEKDESIRIFCVYKFLMRVETFFNVNNLYTVRNNVVCCVKNADCQKRFFCSNVILQHRNMCSSVSV